MNHLYVKARQTAATVMVILLLGGCSRPETSGASDRNAAQEVAPEGLAGSTEAVREMGVGEVEDASRYVKQVYAEHGIASPEAADAFGLASAICSKGAVPGVEGSTTDQKQAIESIRKACSSFDQKGLQSPEYSVRLFIPSQDAAPDQLERLAQEAISVVEHPVSLTEANAAARFLIMHEKFPNQGSYQASKEDLFLAYGMANGLRYCEKNHCGPSSLMTLAVCAHSGCEPGWNYATAISQSMGPKDMRLVQALMRTIPPT